jgi:hypothetical protein
LTATKNCWIDEGNPAVARKNPLTKLTTAAIETLKHPAEAAEKAVGQAKGTVGLGRAVAEQVTRTAGSRVAKAAGAVTSLVPGGKPKRPATEGRDAGTATPPSKASTASKPTSKPEPVKAQADVVEPLVRKQAAERAAATPAAPEPVTEIDKGAADVEVDVTPADIAKVVAKKAPARKKPAAKKAAPAEKPVTLTAENTPGAKLPPPRRPADDTESAKQG